MESVSMTARFKATDEGAIQFYSAQTPNGKQSIFTTKQIILILI